MKLTKSQQRTLVKKIDFLAGLRDTSNLVKYLKKVGVLDK